MDYASTYGLLGIPDGVATAFVLISLSLLLTPWFGGLEIGPLKVPKPREHQALLLKRSTPIVFLITLALFYPVWPKDDGTKSADTLNELALRWLEEELGRTSWNGGEQWGEVVFEDSGRAARYSNAPGRSKGSIRIIGGDFSGSGFIVFSGAWFQDDGREGELELIPGYENEIQVRWGPENKIFSEWVKLNLEGPLTDDPELPVLRWAALEQSASSFGPIFVDSLKVQAAGTGGRTVQRVVELDAGSGRAFLPGSIDFEEFSRSGGGRIEARFLEDRFQYIELNVEIDGDTKIVRLPQKIYISLYAETGSGAGNFNRGAWINGNVTARIVEVPS
ncbi:hypothetical protein [uncultured Roseobacter sp.]|uniref:hypothetical protein n=1 Tax=uncultured Roseobacter sp. TaxID=114847 RepID=UPI00262A9CA8|nr:hypothetical protein [uncultured Roseobacter sp.]